MTDVADTRILLGRITTVYGVKGWVKVHSSTEPMDNIFNYKPWQVCINGQWRVVELKRGERHSKGLIAQLADCQDRDAAKLYCGADIAVQRSQLPTLPQDDYYWQQLTGLNVETETGISLGQVSYLMATGANDVLVVQGQTDSIDRKERLIPWLPNQVITKIDMTKGVIRVDWDPEF
jgi:16S rRNA processing protein RimM